MNMLSPYGRKRADADGREKNTGRDKYVIVESASALYTQLEGACAEGMSTDERYDILRSVFRRAVEQAIANCPIAFVGFFSKVDFCVKEYQIPYTIANLIQMARRDIFPMPNSDRELSDDELERLFPHNIKATALLVYWVCGKEEIPESLKSHFPKADRKNTWGKFSENVLRVVVARWDDNFIWATEEENNTTLKICYGKDNRILTLDGKADWSYLKTVLWEGAQMNLVRIRMDERGETVMPELIILEPDFLVNITTIASCFETYAESPFVNLINKIKPNVNNRAIQQGGRRPRTLVLQ